MTARPSDRAAPFEFGAACPVPAPPDDRIVLGHGGGGRLTAELIDRVFRPTFSNPTLDQSDDSARLMLDPGAGRLAFSTDAHVVHPLEFPGGDIGRLAVCGTVNDLAMVGAIPRWLSAAFVIEEGLPVDLLARLVRSMGDAAAEAGVRIVAGDTKVTPGGDVDGLMICTAGIGIIPPGRDAHGANARPGDAVIVSGPIGNHGIAVVAARGDLALRTEVRSDTRPVNGIVEALFAAGVEVHAMRDPTRGGLAATLNEIARSSGVAAVLEEERIPVDPEVQAACELLGFDPLHVANEGTFVAFVPGEQAERALSAVQALPAGAGARRIGYVEASPAGRVLVRTTLGPMRIVAAPSGELLPRIC